MQEPMFYRTLLGELTDEEFVETVGREMRARGRNGMVLCCEQSGEKYAYASYVFPASWETTFLPMGMAQRIQLFAAYVAVNTNEEVSTKMVAEDREETDGYRPDPA